MKGEAPIEYQRGFTKFLNCKIDLRKRVFIPEIETEYWVKKAIEEIKDLRFKIKDLKILDIFAGSGCIGIAILKACPELVERVDFVDNDEKAISQIKINLKLNLPRTELVLVRGKIPKNRYKIYQSNLFEKLKGEKYDFIFANPPYVAKERIKEVQPSVLKYEPKKAILAGKKGLFYIKKFLKEAKKFLTQKGIIYLEIDPLQKEEIKKILLNQGYKKFQFFKDQFKKCRFVKIINMSENVLLQIVRTWKISRKPEYRGFRCANCQEYIHKAWHRWLRTGGFEIPVHFCNNCEKKVKLFQIKGIYKTFTCDRCGKKMHKAWHVWTKKTGILSESHFCKKCGNKLGFSEQIKGVIYDLDGTIISTIKLHESAWLCASKKFNIRITDEMLLNQSGISNEVAAKMMVPNNKKHLTKRFIATKVKYVMENVNQAALFPDVTKVISRLLKNGYKIWICTSAHKNFVIKILNHFHKLKEIIGNNVVWREMYKREKPSPDALNLTTKKMRLTKPEVYYIGDAFSDYKTSIGAKIKFIYFYPNLKKRDLRIPKSVLTISSHREILKLLK